MKKFLIDTLCIGLGVFIGLSISECARASINSDIEIEETIDQGISILIEDGENEEDIEEFLISGMDPLTYTAIGLGIGVFLTEYRMWRMNGSPGISSDLGYTYCGEGNYYKWNEQ